MSNELIEVKRLPIRLEPDPRRTIARFFWPGPQRAQRIIERIKKLSPERISELLNQILKQFRPVTPDLEEILMEHAEEAIQQASMAYEKDFEIRMLIGAYFSMEYAFESSALCNPSIIPSEDQSEVPEGSLRFVMSLRAVGEGHVSSITFRRGIVDARGDITINPASLQVRSFKRQENRKFEKSAFKSNLQEMSIHIKTRIRRIFREFQGLCFGWHNLNIRLVSKRQLISKTWFYSLLVRQNRGEWKTCAWYVSKTMTEQDGIMEHILLTMGSRSCRRFWTFRPLIMQTCILCGENSPRTREWPCSRRESTASML
jgi:hypothetical protein